MDSRNLLFYTSATGKSKVMFETIPITHRCLPCCFLLYLFIGRYQRVPVCRLCNVYNFQKMFTHRLKHTKRLRLRFSSSEAKSTENVEPKSKERGKRAKHTFALARYFNSAPHLKEIKQYIPDKYLKLKRSYSMDNLYLVDTEIASAAVNYMQPYIQRKPQAICETGVGLGLITSELLERKFRLVRLYEPCPDFRHNLRDFNKHYPGRVELFVKDIFQLYKMSSLDKMDQCNRVGQMLRGVPKRKWHDSPAMTIVGVMPKIAFISYLMKMLALQSEIVTYGQVQLFAFMRPSDYIKLTAGPQNNLHTYQRWSVLFNLLFDHQLLAKFPKAAFLPWETRAKLTHHTRSNKRVDLDQMYFVRINFKKVFSVDTVQLLPLYFFVRQFFGRGTNKVIPTVEKFIPGIGWNLIVTTMEHKHYFKNINIYTKFGELTPLQILALFKEMINHPGYANSSFAAMVQSELLKTETRDISPDDILNQPDIIQDLEEKLDS